jgi:hypothetical protein
MKRCEICEDLFNPHEEVICKKCKDIISDIHIERYHEAKDRISVLEERIAEFLFECSQRNITGNWITKEIKKFIETLENDDEVYIDKY